MHHERGAECGGRSLPAGVDLAGRFPGVEQAVIDQKGHRVEGDEDGLEEAEVEAARDEDTWSRRGAGTESSKA